MSSTLVKAAKLVGSVAGKIASLTGAEHTAGEPHAGEAHETPAAAPVRGGKLPKKHKSRLPRRVKKALAKQNRAA